MKKTRILCFSICVRLLALASLANAQDIRFQAEVDKTRLTAQDVLILSFSISGGNIDLNMTPELPDLSKDFDILQGPSRSTQISIVNNKQSSTLSLSYALAPKHAGTLEIGAATLAYKNHTYATQPISIEVLDAPAPGQASPQAETPTEDAAPQLYLHAEIDKPVAYIGEQLTVSFWLYTQLSIAGYEMKQQPNFTGFWVEELRIPQPPKLEYRTINGQQYGVALLKRFALFPASSGELTIDPMLMVFAVRVNGRQRDPFDIFNDPFFDRTQEVVRKSPPLAVNILPLPEENRPAAFNGDVGHFSMAVEAAPREVTQDEPVTVKVAIQGNGNIKTVKEPVMTLPQSVKKYDTQIQETPYPMQEPLQGEKVFETVIIPTESGAIELPPVEFSYFDPARKSYQTLRSEPIALTVRPKSAADAPIERKITTKEEIKLLGKDIRFIKTDAPRLKNQGGTWYRSGWMEAAYLLPFFLIGGAILYKRHLDRLMSDIGYVRQRGANKRTMQRLKRASDLLKRGEAKEFYAAASSALRQYVGDKLNLPPASLTDSDGLRRLEEMGVDAETAALLKRCLEQCDFARFAAAAGDEREMNALLRDAEQVIERIETSKIGRSGARNQAIPVALLLFGAAALLLPATARASAADDLFRQGNAFYEAGKFAEAIAMYQQIVDSGLRNGYVYYNLGNALLKQNRIGEAILQYERAKRLLPRDEDVAYNLEYARASTVDNVTAASGRLAAAFERARAYFTPQEVAGFFWLCYLLLTALIIAFIFAPHEWKLRLIYLMLLPAFCVLGSAVLLLTQMSLEDGNEAIVISAKADAKTGPGPEYSTIFEIHEGANVRIQREKLDWVEIKLPNKVIGWVRPQDVAVIFPAR